MSDNIAKSVLVINDTDSLCRPDDQQPLLRRIKDLSTQQYTTQWMQVEVAAIATLLEDGDIAAGQVWQLTLPHYNIAPSVSSTPNPYNGPDWLARPLADRALVWDHLTVLCAAQEVTMVPALPGPYDDRTPETDVLVAQAFDFLTRGLNLFADRDIVSGVTVLGQFEHRLRHDIKHHLAVQWFGGMHAVGASLHALPLPGGSFGLDDQPVYVLKALVEVLKRDIADYEDASLVDQGSFLSRELLGRIQLWWGLIKGYTYDMVHTYQGKIVVAMLVKYPSLTDDLRTVLAQGLELGNSGQPVTPAWGCRGDCEMQWEIAETATANLVEQLDERLVTEKRDSLRGRL